MTQSQRRLSCLQPPGPQSWAAPFSTTMAVVPLGHIEIESRAAYTDRACGRKN